jgi:uncharacterized protein (DUF1810 family)
MLTLFASWTPNVASMTRSPMNLLKAASGPTGCGSSFPNRSSMAQRYAICDLDQAARCLADPVLGSRLRHDVRLMTSHKDKSAQEILGSPDDLKFRSCITLFAEAASDDSDRLLFKQALEQFYGGEPDPRTMELLRSTSPRILRLENDVKSRLR